MTNAKRIAVLGTFLIGAGIVVVLRQIFTAPVPDPHLWGLTRWLTGTEFPGLPMIGLGGLLLFVTIFMRS
jgi:hypothetical protein